jgi:protein-tyrosine kinase
MDYIRQALERAKSLHKGGPVDSKPAVTPQFDSGFDAPISYGRAESARPRVVELDLRHLESRRIIAHDDSDHRTRSFDMLRTQVLQAMDKSNWRILGITSPSPDCGKTVTAINLALSISRQPDRSAILVDLDFPKPVVASDLGLNCNRGLIDVLKGKASLAETIVEVGAADAQISVLPTLKPMPNSSAWVTSRELSAALQEVTRTYRSHTIILDLPPLLTGDDVIALLPRIDCLLLVAAVDKSTVAELEECNKHLQSAQVLRLILNKVPGLSKKYYYPYYYGRAR